MRPRLKRLPGRDQERARRKRQGVALAVDRAPDRRPGEAAGEKPERQPADDERQRPVRIGRDRLRQHGRRIVECAGENLRQPERGDDDRAAGFRFGCQHSTWARGSIGRFQPQFAVSASPSTLRGRPDLTFDVAPLAWQQAQPLVEGVLETIEAVRAAVDQFSRSPKIARGECGADRGLLVLQELWRIGRPGWVRWRALG